MAKSAKTEKVSKRQALDVCPEGMFAQRFAYAQKHFFT